MGRDPSFEEDTGNSNTLELFEVEASTSKSKAIENFHRITIFSNC